MDVDSNTDTDEDVAVMFPKEKGHAPSLCFPLPRMGMVGQPTWTHQDGRAIRWKGPGCLDKLVE